MTTTEDVARALTLVVRDLETAGVPAPAITWVEEWMTMGFPDGSVHGTDLSQATQQAAEGCADGVRGRLGLPTGDALPIPLGSLSER
jgi:hypothetical protein